MRYVLEQMADGRCIRFEFDGRVTISDLEQSRRVLKDVLRESDGTRKVLVDMQNASLEVSTIDIHQFVASHRDELPADLCVALLVQSKDWSNAIFAENVAYNRSLCLRAFRDDLQARVWLGMSD